MDLPLTQLVNALKVLREAEKVLMNLDATPEQRGHVAALCVQSKVDFELTIARTPISSLEH